MKFNQSLCLLTLFLALSANAKTSYESYPSVKKGGVFTDTLGITPMTMVPMLAQDIEAMEMGSQFYLPLFGKDGETYEDYAALAEKVEISKDRKDYTYTLNSKARWSDGSPVTSDDVEFTFQKLMDPKVEAAALRGYFEGVSLTKIDGLRFKFHTETPKFNTLSTFNEFQAIQKKQFEKEADFNKTREALRPIGNAAYKLKTFSRDQVVTLERDLNWWGKDLPQFKARFNFDLINFKIISDSTLRYEKLIRGEIDTTILTSDQYVTQVNGVDKARFGKTPKDGKSVWADKLKTDGPMGWFGMALNAKTPVLSSVKTRKGIAYLIDYESITQKAFFGTMEQSVSPFGSNSDNVAAELKNPKNRYHLDLAKAAELFKADGWVHEPNAPFLMKEINGKKVPFHFVLKFPPSSPAQSKAAQMLKEIFKKAGVDLELRAMDGTALYKDFEESNFEANFMGWGGGSLDPDPKQLWSTDSIKGGSNKVSYSNPKVDALIKKANVEFNRKKRSKLLQEIGSMLYDELPYIFICERHFVLQGTTSRIKSPKWMERFGAGVAKDLFYE
jgi:peptide/nickel transport system substrate-binding protein/microcin C transport system substrate-binding protein